MAVSTKQPKHDFPPSASPMTQRKTLSWTSILFCMMCLLSTTVNSFVVPTARETTRPTTSPTPPNGIFASRHWNLHLERILTRNLSADDSADSAEPLPLTAADLERLSNLKSRSIQMPIMILDAMLPLQKLTFQSSDPKFNRLVDYCLESPDCEIGMLGLNPHTGRPLCRGVTLKITNDNIQQSKEDESVTMFVQADRRMEVQGEPWLDDSDSFYLADVEIVEDREESLSQEQRNEAQRLCETIPGLLGEWTKCVVKSKITDAAGIQARMHDLGKMPNQEDITGRALWTAALLNPLPALGVCLEIRPAMLSCSNDFDRMVLVCQALQSSIDHLTGKRRLF